MIVLSELLIAVLKYIDFLHFSVRINAIARIFTLLSRVNNSINSCYYVVNAFSYLL